jgi:hypothetical protein
VSEEHAPASNIPVPDPTTLTTEALRRDISALEKYLTARSEGYRLVIETRLDAMDRAKELLRADIDKQPDETEKRIADLRQLHEEKFSSIQTQFTERDTRAEQTAKDSKVAVDAALQAAKEAVAEQNKSNAAANSKMEQAFDKRIDQQGLLITASTAGLNDKIDQQTILINSATKTADDKLNDLKDRVTRIEGLNIGVTVVKDDSRASSHLNIAIAAAVIAIIGVAVSIVTLVIKSGAHP